MKNLWKTFAGLKWMPDAAAENAPADALLVADNTVPDISGGRSLRLGSTSLYTGWPDLAVNSLYSFEWDGVTYRFAGVDDKVYRNGVDFGETFDGAGDISFGDDAYQVFMARGATRKKFDGTSFYNWSIAAPEFPVTLAASTALTTEIASFNSVESPAFKINEGEAAFVDGPSVTVVSSSVANPSVITTSENHGLTTGDSVTIAGHTGSTPDINGTRVVTVISGTTFSIPVNVTVAGTGGTVSLQNAAMQLTPDAGSGRASASKAFKAVQDFLDILGSPGGGTDQFTFRLWLEEPRKVDKITVMFGLNPGPDPFQDDHYYFDFNIRTPSTVDVKDASSNAAAAYSISTTQLQSPLSPEEVTEVKTPAEIRPILERLGRYAGSRSTERRDPNQNSPAWGALTVTRGQFNRVGGTAGRDWSTVYGFKVVVTMVPGSTEVAYFDSATWTGGGSRALTGTFRAAYRFARDFKVDGATVYTELSPLSPLSDTVVLNQQALQVTIPAAALAAKDPQVDQTWIYLYGGFLDTYYRFAITGTVPSNGMTIDELSNTPNGSNLNTPEERTRATTHGFSVAQGSGTSSTDVVITIAKSELEALIENEFLEPGLVPIPSGIIAVAGPWNSRLFMLDAEGWLWVTSAKRPSSVSLYHTIDLRRYGVPRWLARTSSGIVAGFSDDVVRIAGTGDLDANQVTLDLYGDPLNCGNPPIDSTVATDGNSIVYRSADGLMLLSGSTLQPIPFAGTRTLWTGRTRHGISALDTTTGRFRVEVDNHSVYMLAPEGSLGSSAAPVSIWRYDPEYQQWSRLVYPFDPLSIFRENAGSLLVGSDEGSLHEIEVGTQDDGDDINVRVVTPWESGGNPLVRKDPVDFQIQTDTGGEAGTVTLYTDGDDSTVAETIGFSTAKPNVFRSGLSTISTFRTLRAVVAGAFNQFVLGWLNLTYRERPQMAMAVDLGCVIPPGGGDVAWITEVLADLVTPSDFELLIYHDDVLKNTLSVTATPNRRTTYRIPVPRGTKSRRLRLVVRTTAAAAAGSVGFEVYKVQVRHRGTGNLTSLSLASSAPLGEAE